MNSQGLRIKSSISYVQQRAHNVVKYSARVVTSNQSGYHENSHLKMFSQSQATILVHLNLLRSIRYRRSRLQHWSHNGLQRVVFTRWQRYLPVAYGHTNDRGSGQRNRMHGMAGKCWI